VSKHKSIEEKLTALRTRIKKGEVIANRDIRSAFGKQYVVYDKLQKAAVKYAKDYNRERNSNRSEAQQNVAKLIKQVLMLDGRGADSAAHIERACEQFEEMDVYEREAMNYWNKHAETNAVQWNNLDALNKEKIYKEKTALRLMDVKQDALVEAINKVIGEATEVQRSSERLTRLLGNVKQY
jgi:hypothetical protein